MSIAGSAGIKGKEMRTVSLVERRLCYATLIGLLPISKDIAIGYG